MTTKDIRDGKMFKLYGLSLKMLYRYVTKECDDAGNVVNKEYAKCKLMVKEAKNVQTVQ